MNHDTEPTEARAPRRFGVCAVLRLLLPVPVAFFQLASTRFAAATAGQEWGPGRRGPWTDGHSPWETPVDLPPWPYLLALVGPIALFWSARFPRSVIAVCALPIVVLPLLGYSATPAVWSLLIAALLWVRRMRSERRAAAALATRADAERRAGAERLRIAQELHDVLAHHISLINVQSGVALHLMDDNPEQTRTALAAIKSASKESLTALRGALDALRNTTEAAPRAPTAGLSQLDSLLASVRGAGLDVTLRVTGERRALDQAPDLAALRIIQESLTNVLRHAEATHVDVELAYGTDSLDIRVADDGRGGAHAIGNGLSGMSERAVALGGEFRAGPRAGGGFEVAARLPI